MLYLSRDPERAGILARRLVAANAAVLGAPAGAPGAEARERELAVASILFSIFAAPDYLGDEGERAMQGALDGWLARDGAERTRRESATPPVAHDEPWECVIMCRKSSHCEGCDQCQDSTRERVARPRDGSGSVFVRYCDDCAATVNAGEHDTFASADVTDAPTVADATGVSR
jgi:hypothetical protein